MAFWLFLYYFSIFSMTAYGAISSTMRASPTVDPTVQTVEATTAEEGREIPVLFGTRYISSTNVVWYGDVRTVAIKQKSGKK